VDKINEFIANIKIRKQKAYKKRLKMTIEEEQFERYLREPIDF
jgi:hypothetical protein